LRGLAGVDGSFRRHPAGCMRDGFVARAENSPDAGGMQSLSAGTATKDLER
jgi:hypothetical protein